MSPGGSEDENARIGTETKSNPRPLVSAARLSLSTGNAEIHELTHGETHHENPFICKFLIQNFIVVECQISVKYIYHIFFITNYNFENKKTKEPFTKK